MHPLWTQTLHTSASIPLDYGSKGYVDGVLAIPGDSVIFFLVFLDYFVLATVATNSIRVKTRKEENLFLTAPLISFRHLPAYLAASFNLWRSIQVESRVYFRRKIIGLSLYKGEKSVSIISVSLTNLTLFRLLLFENL